MQIQPLSTEQFHDGQANRIGPARRSGGKDAVRTIVERRRTQQLEPLRAIKFPENKEMREAFDVGKAGLEVGQNCEHAFGVMLCAEALGNGTRVFVGLRTNPIGFAVNMERG